MRMREFRNRRKSWIEGKWIVLEDGQKWSFPPYEQVPGHHEAAVLAAREIADSLIPLLNIDALKAQGVAMAEGDPAAALAAIRNIGRAFAIYQAVFRVASRLLMRNYDITPADCESLMYFNYQLAEFFDPGSKVHGATPRTLEISNQVAAACGIDFDAEFSRIAQSN